MNRERKKFGEAEIIFGVLIFSAAELALFFITLTGVGVFLSAPLKTFSVFLIEWWAWAKGAAFGTLDTKRILKYIGNVLPLATLITFLVSVYHHNHPEMLGAVQKLGKMNVSRLKEVKQAKGTVAAVKEARTMYRKTT